MSHESGVVGPTPLGYKVFDVAFQAILFIAFFALIGAMLACAIDTHKRVVALERACHGQCKYGDAECDKRCHDAGHCEAK